MKTPRFFLAAPAEDISEETLLACAAAAAKAGDCASILVGEKISATAVPALQALGLAVIIRDCEPRQVHHLKADGIHIARAQPVKTIRATLKTESIGVFAATSRHIAMEASEAGADYIAFAQASQTHGEPLIAWWQDIFEIPAVAFDPVDANGLAALLPQRPDFIRPMDEMWQSPEHANRVVADLAKAMK
jgi:thiamine-phosphate pyrophosphorylase